MGINVKKGGFSIVEIMVSLLLVSLALFTIVAIFPRMGAQKKAIREVDEAYSIAAHILDSLQKEPVVNVGVSTLDNISRDNITFTPVITVEQPDFYKSAIIEIFWTKQKSHSISLAGVVR